MKIKVKGQRDDPRKQSMGDQPRCNNINLWSFIGEVEITGHSKQSDITTPWLGDVHAIAKIHE